MTTELVAVQNGGAGGVIQLDPSVMLSATRLMLQNAEPALMNADQSFMISSFPLEAADEASTPMSAALTTPTGGGTPLLVVAEATIALPTNANWVNLTTDQQIGFLNTVAQITKGLTITNPSGGAVTADNAELVKTTFDIMTPVTATLMTSSTPRILTAITTNAYFSQFAQSMAVSSSNSASLSVDTPYGGGESAYDYAQSHSSSSSSVNTYCVGTYNVNIANVLLDQTQIQLSQDFVTALTNAAETSGAASQFVAVVKVLNQFGWYLPTAFSVGGVLYTSATSQSTSWSEAQSTSSSFGASFKASFDGIGGGAAYKQADTSGTSSSGSTGSDSLAFTAIGGTASDSNDYKAWSTSLMNAQNWNIQSYQSLLPSVFFLYNMSGQKPLLADIANLIANQYANCPELGSLQPVIDCGQYAQSIKELIPPFG